MVFGFSTGSLALSDYRLGIQCLACRPASAIELSALREEELEPLMADIEEIDLSSFDYISVHAPSRFSQLNETNVLRLLQPAFDRKWPVVLHPDVVIDWTLWQPHRELVCIENMDKRKRLGRTADELAEIFQKLPDASLCFDIAHARQIDPTMSEARQILRKHGHRIRQLHISEVSSSSRHERIGYTSLLGFKKIVDLLPTDVPIILESPVSEDEIEEEFERVREFLAPESFPA